MISFVSICNMALAELGATRITDLGLADKNSQLCSEFLSPTIDQVLRYHPWNCARARASLAVLSTAPAFGFAYQYTLPAAPYCLRALRINEDARYVFKVEGRRLLTDQASVDLEFIKRIVNPAEFDPLLVAVIVAKLAHCLAYPITQSSAVRDRMEKKFIAALSEARSVDSQEGSPDVLKTSTWLDARLV